MQPKQQISKHKAKAPSRGTIITEESAYPMQQLARHQAILKLLQDIRFDMQVCALEGWDVLEYPRMIHEAIDGIGDS